MPNIIINQFARLVANEAVPYKAIEMTIAIIVIFFAFGNFSVKKVEVLGKKNNEPNKATTQKIIWKILVSVFMIYYFHIVIVDLLVCVTYVLCV